jgi:hypothetical protein
VDELKQIEIPILFKNNALEKVRADYMSRANAAHKRDGGRDGSSAPKQYVPPANQWYDIELSHPMFTTSSGIMLYNDQKPPPGKQQQAQPTPKGQKGKELAIPDDATRNKCILSFTPTKPADYACHMILKSQDRVDIRLYKIQV